MTRSYLDLQVGVSQPTISQFEIGGFYPLKIQIKKITEILGIGLGTLNKGLRQFYEDRRKELKKRIEGNKEIPEYRCKDCGAVWYGWGAYQICHRCGGKLGACP